MKLCALFSGGKDSAMALYKGLQEHDVETLLAMQPERDDSYMYHVPNIHLTRKLAECMEIPLVEKQTSGKPPEENQDLENALEEIKNRYEIQGVCVGAVRSNYQKKIVSQACEKLDLQVYAPFWHTPHLNLIKEALEKGFEIIFVAVAAEGLDEKWLGRRLDENAIQDLLELEEKIGVDVGGEGGEYETLVLDAPMYKKKLKILEAEKKWDGVRGSYIVKETKTRFK